jgi:hypothetical protein
MWAAKDQAENFPCCYCFCYWHLSHSMKEEEARSRA